VRKSRLKIRYVEGRLQLLRFHQVLFSEPAYPVSTKSRQFHDAVARIAAKCSCTPDGVVEAYEVWHGNKLNYRDKVVDLEAELSSFLRTGKEGKPIRAKHAVKAEKASKRDVIPEPPGWRELAAKDENLKWAANDDWATMDPFYQKQMVELVKGAAA
jgi:hypothetical protein